MLQEKNVPTDPKKWAKWIAQAKKKFDVYPSAYANGWAAKMYKQDGGGWKTMKEFTLKSFKEYIEEKTAYQKFFEKILKKYGVKSPEELNDATKKKFYDEIDSGWNAKNESIDEGISRQIDPKEYPKMNQKSLKMVNHHG